MTENEKLAIEENDSYLEFDNLPNRLTMFRILLIPVVVVCLYLTEHQLLTHYHDLLGYLACLLFTIASVTDFFDGYIARKRNIVTVFGSFLDPIADKFLIIASLIMLMALDRLNAFIVIVLVLREVYMTSLRLLALNEGVQVPVNDLGKWKTATQMVGVGLMMGFNSTPSFWVNMTGPIFIYISAFLSAYSAFLYTVDCIFKLKEKRIEKRLEKKQTKQQSKFEESQV